MPRNHFDKRGVGAWSAADVPAPIGLHWFSKQTMQSHQTLKNKQICRLFAGKSAAKHAAQHQSLIVALSTDYRFGTDRFVSSSRQLNMAALRLELKRWAIFSRPELENCSAKLGLLARRQMASAK